MMALKISSISFGFNPAIPVLRDISIEVSMYILILSKITQVEITSILLK